MSEFDRALKEMARREERGIPDCAKDRVEAVLASLPETRKPKILRIPVQRIAAAAAVFVFISLIFLPNVSAAYAKTLGKVPVLGEIVRVITVRSYFMEEDGYEMEVEVPQITGNDAGTAEINQDTAELSAMLVEAFCREVEVVGSDGHGSLHITYETVMNTERWFTLRLSVSETSAGSALTYYYYHIDRRTGERIRLCDLFEKDGWKTAIEDNLKEMMRAAMEKDAGLTYWYEADDAGFDGVCLTEDHDFILSADGNLIIPFDEYEIAPGSMGTPFFTLAREVFEEFLAEEYRDLFR